MRSRYDSASFFFRSVLIQALNDTNLLLLCSVSLRAAIHEMPHHSYALVHINAIHKVQLERNVSRQKFIENPPRLIVISECLCHCNFRDFQCILGVILEHPQRNERLRPEHRAIGREQHERRFRYDLGRNARTNRRRRTLHPYPFRLPAPTPRCRDFRQ